MTHAPTILYSAVENVPPPPAEHRLFRGASYSTPSLETWRDRLTDTLHPHEVENPLARAYHAYWAVYPTRSELRTVSDALGLVDMTALYPSGPRPYNPEASTAKFDQYATFTLTNS